MEHNEARNAISDVGEEAGEKFGLCDRLVTKRRGIG